MDIGLTTNHSGFNPGKYLQVHIKVGSNSIISYLFFVWLIMLLQIMRNITFVPGFTDFDTCIKKTDGT